MLLDINELIMAAQNMPAMMLAEYLLIQNFHGARKAIYIVHADYNAYAAQHFSNMFILIRSNFRSS